MATRADFTEAEWQSLQWAVVDTMTYLSLADPGFWDTFKEAGGATKYIAQARESGTSGLVRELAADLRVKRDKTLAANPTDVSGEVVRRVDAAVAVVKDKAPADLESFREFILGVARATAEAAKGTGPTEAEAIEKLKAALD